MMSSNDNNRKDREDSIETHYETTLGEVYTWMYGSFDMNYKKYKTLFQEHNIRPSIPNVIAIDLGAGSGFQSIPLANLGYEVHAYDLSYTLLHELKENYAMVKAKTKAKQEEKEATTTNQVEPGGGSIVTFHEDMLNFPQNLQLRQNAAEQVVVDETTNNESAGCTTAASVELIVCMVDTLLHLPSIDAVKELLTKCYNTLVMSSSKGGGKLILSFRDLKTYELKGTDRFINVRNDENTIFTCFLEYNNANDDDDDDDKVLVHDIIQIGRAHV